MIGKVIKVTFCIFVTMDVIMYQEGFLAVSNYAKLDVEYISTGNIADMKTRNIIRVDKQFVINGELNPDKDVYIISEGNDKSFLCIFAKTIAGSTNLNIKRKLKEQEVKKLKRLWQTKG